ncbi:MAG: hypothetical protein MOB07_29765 [Acidobacteria bacterium]|nr:hypothetical protein [Acidobacteriota bacterium]
MVIAIDRDIRIRSNGWPSYLGSIVREIASHQKGIAARDQNERDDFTIELRSVVSSEEAITFTDRGRDRAHLWQICFAVVLSTDRLIAALTGEGLG